MPEPVLGTYGKRVLAARKAKGVDQDQLAAAVGVHVKTVSRWENDRQAPEGDQEDALASFLGVTREWLRRGNSNGARLIVRESSPTHVALGIPQKIRVFIQKFLLELTEAGVPEEEVDAARRILSADELHRVNWGGERDYTEDEILEGIESHAAAFRQRYRRRGYNLPKR